MSRTDYTLPMGIAVSLATERIEFLHSQNAESFDTFDVRRLLTDLISDRVTLRNEVVKAVEALSQLQSQAAAAEKKFSNLLAVLDGSDPEEPEDE